LSEKSFILHLCPRQAWKKAQAEGVYRPASLESEGFIHFSLPNQIYRAANAFYRGQKGMVLLWVDPEQLSAPLRWDPADGDIFPHLYGALNLDAVVRTEEFSPDADGEFRPKESGRV
jgi:uncharacterized protein (DUF952 family)